MDETYYGDSPYTDEELRRIAETGAAGIRERSLQGQRELANALRLTAMPQARSNGRVVTAANPLEFLAAGAERVLGHKQLQKINEDYSRLGESGLAGHMALLRGMHRKPFMPQLEDVTNDLSNIPMPKYDEDEEY